LSAGVGQHRKRRLRRKEAPMRGVKKYGGIALAIILVLIGIFLIKDPYSAGQFVSNYFAAGDFAGGVIAAGHFSAGIFAAGTFAIGVFSAGIFSVGVFSIGLFSIGLFGLGVFVIARYKKTLSDK
jgi:polyferredoxin